MQGVIEAELVLHCRHWSQLVFNFNVLLQNYKHHCVSKSALMLHLKGDHEVDKQQVGQMNACHVLVFTFQYSSMWGQQPGSALL